MGARRFISRDNSYLVTKQLPLELEDDKVSSDAAHTDGTVQPWTNIHLSRPPMLEGNATYFEPSVLDFVYLA